MATKNRKTPTPRKRTHEGAPAVNTGVTEQLRRSVMSCLLWEDEFYENGQKISDRIADLAQQVNPKELADIAFEARTQHNLRHVPLLLLYTLTKTGAGVPGLVAGALARTIQRADEMGEFLAIYKEKSKGKMKLSAQTKKGLAAAFAKFDEYQLAKYDRDTAAFKIRDVMFLVRPNPVDAVDPVAKTTRQFNKEVKARKALHERVAERKLETPDTWEVALSSGADKKETFERLIREGNLGYFALLRNLRNMEQAGVDTKLVNDAIRARKNGAHRILPFRFTAAARAAPRFERALDDALCANIEAMPALPGTTVVLVDVSGSMDVKLSGKSDLTRMDAAATLAAVVNAEDLRVFTFSNNVVETKARRGMAGVEEIVRSQPHGGTRLGAAVEEIKRKVNFDRLIVISDEQAHDIVRSPIAVKGEQTAYMINVASAQNGVGYRNGWVHIDGFSEAVLKFVAANEGLTD